MATKVLIIDDSAVIGMALTMRLKSAGYEAAAVRSGTAGIQEALQNRPDVVVMDVNMPNMDGFEVHRQMQASPELRNVPVIFLTGDHLEDVMLRAKAAGVKEVLPKLNAPGALAKAIDAAVGTTPHES